MSVSRRRWRIENWLFHIKNDNCGEGSHKLQSHTAGTIMGLLRATALNLLRGTCLLRRDTSRYCLWREAQQPRPAVLAASEMALLNEDRDLTILVLVPKLK